MKTMKNTHTHTHTPGPWKVAHRMGRPVVVNSTPTHGGPLDICEAYTHPLAHETISDALEVSEANARLIAAAPDLLQALKELCADKYLADPINADRMKNARLAISKAEGRA